MKDINKISEKVEKRKKQLQPLFTKDEENYDLWAGKEQIFDTHKMAINITGPEMTATALRVLSSLNRSRLDVHVLPPKPLPNPNATSEANQEERMYYHGFEKADEKLLATGNAALLPSASWQVVVLGRSAVRVLVYVDPDTKEIIWDYLPLVPRFLSFEFDRNGLAWGCYETFRSPSCIYNEYGVEVTEDAEGKGVSVSDYWDREHNVRFLTKDKILLGKTWQHKFGDVPIILQPVTRGPRAIDTSGIRVETWGESIFDPVKTQFRKLNMLRSIGATHAHLVAKAPLDHTYQDGTNPVLETENIEYYPGAMMTHPNSETIQSMKVADIPPSLAMMIESLEKGIQRITGAELHPEWAGSSGAALRIAGQDRQDVETPRIESINNMCTRICRMAKKQILIQKLTIPVKTVVNDTYEVFDMKPKMLDNDFYVKAELVRQDVYDDVEALQRTQMMMQLRVASRETAMDKVLKVEDVPAEIMKMDMEDVEAAVPEIKLRRLVLAYRERGMEEEAKMAEEQLAMLILQKQQALMASMGGGMPGQPPPQGTPPPRGAVPGAT